LANWKMKRQRMKWHRIISHLGITLTVVLLAFGGGAFGAPAGAQTVEPLPSWNDGKAKQSIIAFVEQVTEQGSPDFVPTAERIAVFDNDGTLGLWGQGLWGQDRVYGDRSCLFPISQSWPTERGKRPCLYPSLPTR
jgi:hypothetical protein